MTPRSRLRPTAPARRPGGRPWSFFLHSLCGLQLSLFFGFVCLTGTIATVSHEIEWLLLPKVRATASETPVSWGRLFEAARAAHPQVVFSYIARPSSGYEDYLARVVSGSGPDGRIVEVYVDPGTGEVTGHSTGPTFHAVMRGLHYYLLAPTALPFYAVTALGVVMLVSLVTGLLVYKKFWRGFFKWPRFDAAPRVWWGDLHRLVGLWSTWFVLTIGLTSVWYLIEHTRMLRWEPPPPRLEHPLTPGEQRLPDAATLDRWVAQAEQRMPGLRIASITLSARPEAAAVVQGQWRAWLVRERTNAVYLDPRSGQVIGVRDAGRLPLTERWVHTADPLHFGDFLGLPSKLVWVLFGLALTTLAASGAVIHARRTVDALRRVTRRAEPATPQPC